MRPLFIGQVMVGLIVVIMINDRHVPVEILLKLFCDRGLAAACAAGNADHHDLLVLHTFHLP